MKARTKKALVLVREIALGLMPAALIIGIALMYIWAVGRGYWPANPSWNQCDEVGVQYRIPCETDDGNLALLTKDGETVIFQKGER